MRLLNLTIIALVSVFATGCISINGQLGYTDPKTGATVGIGIGNQPPPTFKNDGKRVIPRE